ncbi:7-cyano-7-deazaguanine/7-aminomethyl-7-deazaguanine transporter [Neisseriaceae bacterium PsAf]|nr:7-cyano-7-deazaguanine/7-aminomethyl-7-deazaguanine transporter [Neisseriaceae bacterium PsAf]MCV2502635.1 7-cyano-7-deazaguanine/7-aminomethyl-7-deazaguanine transporter [Neisseriaceae bacterium]
MSNSSPLTLNRQQQQKAITYLSFCHILIIAASNYLVQIPFTVFGIHATWGALTFPFIFLTTDLTVRIFGASLARKIILVCMFPAIIISYIVSVLFSQGHWQGLDALLIFNCLVARIALASFLAYVLGQFMDIVVFNRLRQIPQWWVAPLTSTVIGNALDTLVFFFIAFYNSTDEFMANHWIEIAWVDYGFKLFISALFFLPLYGITLRYLIRKLIK